MGLFDNKTNNFGQSQGVSPYQSYDPSVFSSSYLDSLGSYGMPAYASNYGHGNSISAIDTSGWSAPTMDALKFEMPAIAGGGKTPGMTGAEMGGLAIDGLKAAGNMWMGWNSLKNSRNALAQSKDQWDKQYAIQLEDRAQHKQDKALAVASATGVRNPTTHLIQTNSQSAPMMSMANYGAPVNPNKTRMG